MADGIPMVLIFEASATVTKANPEPATAQAEEQE